MLDFKVYSMAVYSQQLLALRFVLEHVYYRSVNASVKLSVRFHSTHGIGFLSETRSSNATIFDAFRTTFLTCT